jgi:hypothetical protein
MDVRHDFEPYQELRAEFFPQQNLLRLTTPWTTVEADVAPDRAEAVAIACNAVNSFSEAGDHAEASALLSVFKEHHVAYLKPRQLSLIQEQCSRTKATIRRSVESPPQEWVDSYMPTIAHALGSLPPWGFDVNACLAHAKIDGTDVFDAASAYRFIMHWVFLHLTGPIEVHTHFFELMRRLLIEDEPAFFAAAKFCLRQYHHVTSTSFDCLLPALETMTFARKLVHKLVHEEYGHGRYTADSLRKLGVENPSSLPLVPESVGIMELLRITTTLNPLAFACLFNVFELAGEQDEDPLAALLAKSSKPESANGIRAHFEFNRAGAHFTSGILLLEGMGGVDSYTVIEAARCVELNLMLTERLCEKSLNCAKMSRSSSLTNAA